MAKQSGGNTAQRVEALVRPTVEGMGLRLWDVVFEKEGPDWYLRVLIDKDGTMDTDTCADVSHALDPILDEADPIDQSYYLEVGSPGLGRKLTRPALRAAQGPEDSGKAHPPQRRRRARAGRHPDRPRGHHRDPGHRQRPHGL